MSCFTALANVASYDASVVAPKLAQLAVRPPLTALLCSTLTARASAKGCYMLVLDAQQEGSKHWVAYQFASLLSAVGRSSDARAAELLPTLFDLLETTPGIDDPCAKHVLCETQVRPTPAPPTPPSPSLSAHTNRTRDSLRRPWRCACRRSS
jgi:hypothetical protein